MMDMSGIETTLRMQDAIDGKLDEVVQAAERLVNGAVGTRVSGDTARHLSQFNNIIGVATGTRSVELVKNFIRYQIGRRDGHFWRQKKLGENLIVEIDGNLKRLALGVADEASAGQGDDALRRDAHIRLVRLLLGYARRRYVYKTNTQGGDHV